MFKHYFVTALRSAKKDTMGFFINLIGLITGFVVFSFAFAFVNFEKNYDTFWENSERITYAGTRLVPMSGISSDGNYPGTFPAIIDHIKDEFPEIEHASRILDQDWPLKVGNDTFPSKIRIVDPDFFKVFNLTFVEGNAEQLYTNPEAVLLSTSEAVKLFGSPQKAMEQTFQVNQILDVKVVGVFEGLPLNSHFVSNPNKSEFKVILSTKSSDALKLGPWLKSWSWFGVKTYFLITPNTDKSALEIKLTEFSKKHINGFAEDKYEGTFLTTLPENNSRFWSQNNLLLIIQSIGGIILAIAIFNAISLNSTRLISRSGEITMRRILGASRANIINQFVAENIILTLIALGFSIVILLSLEQTISSLIDRKLDISLMLSGGLLSFLIFTAITVGLLSTAYPIYLLTRTASGVSLSQSATQSQGSPWVRQGLTSIQFIFVSALIFIVVIAANQNQFLMNSAPKFKSDRIVAITNFSHSIEGEKIGIIETRLKKIPGVEMVSRTNLPPFLGTFFMQEAILPNAEDDKKGKFTLTVNADPNYVPLHDLKIIAGRNLSFDITKDDSSGPEWVDRETYEKQEGNQFLGNVLVNEILIKEMGFAKPEEALGATIIFDLTKRNYATIVGVIDKKKLFSVNSKEMGYILRYVPKYTRGFSVLFNSPDNIDFETIEETWKDILPGSRVFARTLNQSKDLNMKKVEQRFEMAKTVAFIALILAGSGLYALASHLANSRKKEVGIRKVMGASPSQIIRLFMVQFSKPLIIALLIGLPLGGWVMEEFYMTEYQIRKDIDLTMALTAAAITLAIGWATVFIHVWRASRTHPNDVLHYE